MNGGEEEKAVVKSLKQIVKHTSRRKAAPQVSGPSAPPVMIAPKISKPSSDLGPSLPHVLSLAMDSASSQEDGTSGVENGSTYPLYNPGVLEGGRGWLLHILLQIKPVYHAALALSAYHRRATLSADINHPRQAAALVQQEKHLEICIKLVSQSAQDSCPKKELGLATAVVQLMFFELRLAGTPSGSDEYTPTRL
ncbi:hypothetical protein QQZ08_007985 [Neonectria magnoliae]|uniref:Uncharacterized protein n=1 Tax=Neonectria magnoliae TaxID=2732573 RepID=A0ABR1HWH0_9HYPO